MKKIFGKVKLSFVLGIAVLIFFLLSIFVRPGQLSSLMWKVKSPSLIISDYEARKIFSENSPFEKDFKLEKFISKEKIPKNISPDVYQEIENLYSPVPETRSMSAMRLGGMGKDSKAAIPFLVELLKDYTCDSNSTKGGCPSLHHHSINVGGSAVYALQRIGPQGEEAIVEVIKGEDLWAKANAVLGLRLVKDPSLLKPLLEMLGHEDQFLKLRAAYGLGMLGDQRAVEPLLAVLENYKKDKVGCLNVKSSVVNALGELEDKRAVDPLVKIINKWSTSKDRLHYVWALLKIDEKRGIDVLLSMLETEKDHWTLIHTVAELGRLGDQRAVQPLINLFEKYPFDERKRTHLRTIIISALNQLDGNNDEIVKKFISIFKEEKSEWFKITVIDRLVYTKKRSLLVLIEALNDGNPKVSSRALYRLEAISQQKFGNDVTKWEEWLANI